MIEGGTDTEVFHEYMRRVLCPLLRPGEIGIPDILSPYRRSDPLRLIEEIWAEVRFLSAYSPDLNPIEKMRSKVRNAMRSGEARAESALPEAVAAAFKSVTYRNAINWFAPCG